MTYDELIQSIDDEPIIKEMARIAYEAAASDPKAWYVLDKNGERVHIGDYIKGEDKERKIIGLGNNELFSNFWNGAPASTFEKVMPDSREKWIHDLEMYAGEHCGSVNIEDLEMFLDRAIALGVVNDGEATA